MDRTAHTTIPNVSAIDILSFTSFPRVHSLLGKRFLNHKMRGVSTGCNNDPTQNFRNYLGWFLGAVHPIVGKVIGGKALGVKRAETGFIPEKRAAGHGLAAREEKLGG